MPHWWLKAERLAFDERTIMKEIKLTGSQKIYTMDENIAYQVADGYVLIFLLPVCNGKPMRRLFVGRVGAGFGLPSLHGHLDWNDKNCEWMFLLLPDEEATLNAIPCENKHREAFLRQSGLEIPDEAVLPEVLCRRMAEWYISRNDEEQQRIRRRAQESSVFKEQGIRRLRASFSGKRGKYSHTGKSVSLLYDATTFLCKLRRAPIASIETIRSSCGDAYTMQDIARLSGFACREVTLQEGWFRQESEAMVCFLDGKEHPIVCYPKKRRGVYYWNPADDTTGELTPEMAGRLDSGAYVVCRPLEGDCITIKEITRFAMREFSFHDIVVMLVGMLLATFVNLQFSRLSEMLYDVIIPQGSHSVLASYGCLMAAYMLGGVCFSIAKGVASFRLNSRIRSNLQAAIYDRLFHLPESFFRGREYADLAYRAAALADCYVGFFNNMTQIVLMTVFSSMYLIRMYRFSGALSNVGIAFVVVNMLLTVLIGYVMLRLQRQRSRMTGGMRAFLFQVFSGISTIRSFGSEDHALEKYMGKYVRMGYLEIKTNRWNQFSTAISAAVNAAAIVVLYAMVSGTNMNLSIGGFMGFTSAHSALSASMMQVASCALSVFSMMPLMRDSMELLKVAPERADSGVILRNPRGDIRVAGVSFGYRRNENLLHDINLHIQPGEYIAIVGPSGCGKSTLLRLLLGFEQPGRGKIYYDNVDLSRINKPELRRKMGVVLQDGVLFSGTIYQNIRIARPTASHQEVLAAVAAAGLDADISQMPLGLQTLVSEQAQTISGGQKQRILLARAIVGNPGIMMLDEATSALDNQIQAKVCQNLARMGATRIVVAHRLSTVKDCDRILVMSNGRIAEMGTFEQLMEKKGVFYELARTQQL